MKYCAGQEADNNNNKTARRCSYIMLYYELSNSSPRIHSYHTPALGHTPEKIRFCKYQNFGSRGAASLFQLVGLLRYCGVV